MPFDEPKSIDEITFPLPDSAQRVSSTSNSTTNNNNNTLAPPGQPANKPLLTNTRRAKVVLEPGHSPLDWANKKKNSSMEELTGKTMLQKYTLDDVRTHKTESDGWVVLRGKVYNISPYLPFHPGGKKILMSVAGKDCTLLFDKYHPWVNADFLLDKCLVGFVVRN